jgi:tetratricopeptide (TPR) repeat protein
MNAIVRANASNRPAAAAALLAAALVTGALWLSPRAALADESEAAALFQEAEAAFGRGDYRASAVAFEAAFAADPRGAALYNAGRAWEAAKEPERAATSYARALGFPDLDARQRESADRRMSELGQGLLRVEVSGPPGSVIDAGPSKGAKLPIVVFLAPGERHEIRALYRNGAEEKRTLQGEAGRRLEVRFAEPITAPPTKRAPPPLARSEPTNGPFVVAGAVGLGAAAVAGGAAVALGVLTLDARDEFDASGRRDAELQDRAVTLRTATNAAWIAAGALAATGSVILIAGATRGEPAKVAIGPGSFRVDMAF